MVWLMIASRTPTTTPNRAPCSNMLELMGFEPPRFPAKTAREMRFVDPGVVTRAAPCAKKQSSMAAIPMTLWTAGIDRKSW